MAAARSSKYPQPVPESSGLPIGLATSSEPWSSAHTLGRPLRKPAKPAKSVSSPAPAAPARDAIAKPLQGGYKGMTEPKRVAALIKAIRAYDSSPIVRAGLLLSLFLFPRSGALLHKSTDGQGSPDRLILRLQ